jgi:hypothetical protein
MKMYTIHEQHTLGPRNGLLLKIAEIKFFSEFNCRRGLFYAKRPNKLTDRHLDTQTYTLPSIYSQMKFLMPFLIPFALLCWLSHSICERERGRENMVISIFKRNDGCLGTF